MSRPSSGERLRRLLALVPWVAAHDGPTLADVCARFDCTEAELLADLDLLFVCGLFPYTPDVLIEVDIADGRVWIRYADYFSRPLRLTAAEGLALLAAGNTILAAPGSDPSGPLARGLAKLAGALGVAGDDAIEIALTPASEAIMATLGEAAGSNHQVELEYYSFGRDDVTTRVVDPYAVFCAGGQWYLAAYCHKVGDERLFRVDRVRAAAALDATFTAPAEPPQLAVYTARRDDPRVTLELGPDARWVVEQYPVEDVTELRGGRLRVRLAASERAWLERLLLRLGPDATVVEGDASVTATAAARLLARYRRDAA